MYQSRIEGTEQSEQLAARAFLSRAAALNSVEQLEAAFDAAVTEAGFEGYRLLPLDEDAGLPPNPVAVADANHPGYYRLDVSVDTWAAGWTVVELTGHRGIIDRAERARVALLATLFAGCRANLHA